MIPALVEAERSISSAVKPPESSRTDVITASIRTVFDMVIILRS
jgi:hypothetical protein